MWVGRGPYAKTATRRAEILRAARDSFAERGYAGSSLRDIAERAGTTHAVLQHHFAGKEELLVAVLAQRGAEEMAAAEREVEATFDSFVAYLGDRLLRHQESPELMRLWAELSVAASRAGHPAHAYFMERYAHVRTRITGAVTTLTPEDGLAGGLDPESVTTLLHALLNGLQILWLLDPGLDIVTPLDRFMELVFNSDHKGQSDGS
jgi:AcrR family transcriptional regulator